MSHLPPHQAPGQVKEPSATPRHLGPRLSLFFAATFMLIGIQVPFWPVWLEDQGFSADNVGLLLFAIALGRMVGAPLMGVVADKFGSRQKVLLACCVLLVPTAWAHGMVTGYDAQFALHLLFGFLMAALIPLGDNLALMAEKRYQVDYARARVWGSKGFILTSLGAGLLLTGRDSGLILTILIGCAFLLVLTAIFLPDLHEEDHTPSKPDPEKSNHGLRSLIRDPIFLVGIACSGVLQSSHAALYGFASLHWRSAGHSESVIGLLWTEGVIVEILLFYAAARYLGHLKSTTLFAIGAVGGLIRWSGLAVFDDLPSLVILQAFHALTFACTHLAAMRFLANNVAPAASATAQSLHAALVGGIFMGGSMWASGLIYEAIGGHAFLSMALLSLLGLALALLLRWMQNKHRAQPEQK